MTMQYNYNVLITLRDEVEPAMIHQPRRQAPRSVSDILGGCQVPHVSCHHAVAQMHITKLRP